MRRPNTFLLLLVMLSALGRERAQAEPDAADAARVTPIRELVAEPLPSPDATRPATIRGTVTLWLAHDAWVVQDADGAIWVACQQPGTVPAPLEPGCEVLVSGTLREAAYKPRLCDATVTVLGRPGLPVARPADLDRLFTGLDNSMRVTCEGVVQRVVPTPRGVASAFAGSLILACGSRHVCVDVSGEPDRLHGATLLDARVRVTGIVTAIRNPRGELIAPGLAVSGTSGIQILEPAPSEVTTPVPLNRIGQYRFSGRMVGRIATTGIVTYAAERVLYMQDGGRGIRVIRTGGMPPAVGEHVQASGFLDTSRPFTGLHDATVTRIGTAACPAAMAVEPHAILQANERAWKSRGRAVPSDYDGSLIEFPARLVDLQKREEGVELLLDCQAAKVTARLTGADGARLAQLRPGSGLAVRGICEVRLGNAFDPFASAAGSPPVEVALLLRSADDVTLVSTPSWWTPRRLLAVLAATAAALTAVLAWAWLLRRQVATQAGMLAREMRLRRDAAIEFEATLRERNRLAANLHDTLLQTLVGVDYQLGACGLHGSQAATGTAEHLGIARGMLSHATQELRQSVWALRSVPLDGRPFVEAVSGVVAQISQGHPEAIDVHAEGEALPLPKFVAGNLLLVAQEAVHNALQHAAAGRIDVIVRFDGGAGQVTVEVRDDGRGCDPAGRPGPAEGHFGLAGMRERVERLGGEFSLTSRPGGGTTVRAVVALRPFDTDLE